MSIILGALGGAGAAMQDMGAKWMASDLALEKETKLAGVKSDLETKRQQTLELFKNNLAVTTAEQQRTAKVGRIDAAAGGIVTGKINEKYADSDKAVAAAAAGASPEISAAPGNESVQAALTPEQQAVIDQSKASDRAKLLADPNTRVQAAVQTGDIALESVMNNTSKLAINQLKMDNLLARAADKNATQKQIADVRTAALKYNYELRLQAAQEKKANGKIDAATQRMLITSLDTDIRASTSQLNMLSRQLTDTPVNRNGKPNPVYLDIQTQISDLRNDISSSKKQKAAFFSDVGITSNAPAARDSAASPAAKPISALPPGAVQIGTSGGKPVYQAPNGKQFISQ